MRIELTPPRREIASTIDADVSLELCHALRGLEHGEITLKVHDGKVVLIERIARLKPQCNHRPPMFEH